MSDNKSNNTRSEASVPEIWTSLRDRLEPTHTRSRYQVSDDGGLSKKEVENLLDAHDLALNRPVSLKQLRPDDISDPSQLESFINEARLTGSLQHPNIIPVHDLVPDEHGALYFTLRHVDGKKLSSLLNQGGNVSLNDGITIFNKVCDAIAYAHNSGVYHTALSGNAIIIGNFGEVFVMNWGKAVSEVESADNAFKDIQALGRILKAIVEKTVGESDKVPLSLDAIIRRAARVQGNNYPSVEAMRNDIGRFMSGLPTEAEEASFIRHAVLLMRRHKLEAAALMLATLIIFIMTTEFIQEIRLEQQRADEAATRAGAALASVEANTNRELKALEDLKGLTPLFVGQIKIDLANGQPDQALERAEIARTLTRDAPDSEVLELHGDILQLLNRFKESIDSYREIRPNQDNRARIQNKIRLSQDCLKKVADGEAVDNVMGRLYLEMAASKRTHEANVILNDFRERQFVALKTLPASHFTMDDDGSFKLQLSASVYIEGSTNSGEMDVIWNCTDDSASTFDLISNLPFTVFECKSGKGIDSLDALRGKPLMVLKLAETKVSRLDALKGLPLKYLRIEASKAASLEPLRGLPLETVMVRNSPYTSVAPLSGLNLKTLDISGSSVQLLTPLKSQLLEKFSCASTRVTDLSGMNLSRTVELNISHTGISDLRGLKIGKLSKLQARYAPLTDITPLKGNPLGYVDITGSKITSLEPLSSCPLDSLGMGETKVTSLEAVAAIPSLKRLNIAGSAIEALPDNSWKDMTVFIANGIRLVDLRPLKGRPLRSVELANTSVSDIAPIVNRLLNKLYMPGTPITDLTPLENSNVKYLNISGTKVKDLRSLRKVFLSSLDISDTPVTSLAGLEKQPLQHLNIRGVELNDLTPLKGSILKTIIMDPGHLASLSTILDDMPFLQTVQVGETWYSRQTLPIPEKAN